MVGVRRLKTNYTYQMCQKDISTIVRKIKKSGEKFDRIVAISRGGLVPGVILSHRLGIKDFIPLGKLKDPNICKLHAIDIPQQMAKGKKILFVDDILDTGNTLKFFIRLWADMGLSKETILQQCKLAFLIYNSDLLVECYYGTAISRKKFKTFINFWWEKP